MIINTILTRVIGTSTGRALKRMQPIVEEIGSHEPSVRALSDEQLAARSVVFRERLARGESLDQLLPEVFATVR